jgi:hypothetical protein
MSTTTEKFDLWCIVELFGHSKIAGRCTEQTISGANMLRVDVPAAGMQPSFTRFFNASAIYSINPVDELTACHVATQLQVKPIEAWNVSELVKKHQLALQAIPGAMQLVPRARTPEIMADAAYAILVRNSREFTGQHCIDDIVLAEAGITDLRGYRVQPGDEELEIDLFVPDNMPPPAGILV